MSKDLDIKDAIKLYQQQLIWKNKSAKELAMHIIPSVALNQYHIFRYENTGVAYAFTNWAFLNYKTENKFKQTGKLDKFDWDIGNNIWHIDTINTHPGKLNTIYTWVCNNFLKTFPNHSQINWIRLNKYGNKILRINNITIKEALKKFSND